MAQRQEATKLGKELRKLRVDHEISRAQMAKSLKITDRELSLIEIGKSQVTDDLLALTAKSFSNGEMGEVMLLSSLHRAHANSVKSVTFDMTLLSSEQRDRVLELKSEFNVYLQVKNEQAELEAKKLKEEKFAERKVKKALNSEAKISGSTIVAGTINVETLPEGAKAKVRTNQTLREAIKQVEPEPGLDDLSLDDLDHLMAELENS